jgi:hypothetical protein
MGGGAMGRSAAKAQVENKVAAPAASKDFTLRIGFIPFADVELEKLPTKTDVGKNGSECLSGA